MLYFVLIKGEITIVKTYTTTAREPSMYAKPVNFVSFNTG